MALAKMHKMTLVGLSAERKKLLKSLQKLKFVEITETGDIEDTGFITGDEERDILRVKLARYDFCFEFMNAQRGIVKKALKKKTSQAALPKRTPSIIAKKPDIVFEEFTSAPQNNEAEAEQSILRLEALNTRLIEIRTAELKAKNLIDQLKPYTALEFPFDKLTDTKFASVAMGLVSKNKAEQAETVLSAFKNVYFEFFTKEKAANAVLVFVCLKEDRDAVAEKLAELDFTASNLRYGNTAAELTASAEAEIKELDEEKIRIAEEALFEEKYLEKYKLLYDFYSVELQKAEAEGRMRSTGKAFVLNAWLPEQAKEKTEKTLTESKLHLAFDFREPEEGETPPTMCVNNGFADPYEYVTNLYSAPAYGEIDPNPIMSVWYVVLFGIMLSDAVYGLILTLATGIILLVKKSKRGEDRLMKIIFMGGISTMFWGVMFGTYAGFDGYYVTQMVEGTEKQIKITYGLLLNPMENAVEFIGLSIVMGVLHIMTGIGIKSASLFKSKKPVAAILEAAPWYLIFIGIGCVALNMFLIKMPIVSNIGLWLAVAGIVLLLVAGAYGKKGIGKKISGAFSNLYGIINMFSDVLSYIRLFGLGLATGVVGFVFNTLAEVFIGMIPYFGYVIYGVIFLIGHTFNIAINTLGAYVHNSRLQYVEFYGKFYTGGGELFAPLGSRAKYYRID